MAEILVEKFGQQAPKRPMPYAVIWERKSSQLEIEALRYDPQPQEYNLSLKPGFEPTACDFNLKANIWASRLEFEHWAWNLNLKAKIWLEFEFCGYISLEVGISALKLEFKPQEWIMSLDTGFWALRFDFEAGF